MSVDENKKLAERCIMAIMFSDAGTDYFQGTSRHEKEFWPVVGAWAVARLLLVESCASTGMA